MRNLSKLRGCGMARWAAMPFLSMLLIAQVAPAPPPPPPPSDVEAPSAGPGLAPGVPLEFEAATVKSSAPPEAGRGFMGLNGGPGTADPSQIKFTNLPLRTILANAYQVKRYQIEGPGWIDTERYDIVARVPAGATADQAKAMMRNLLAERFQMKVHRETKELPAYVLTVAKNGPKFKESVEAPTPASHVPGSPPANGPPPPPRMGKDGFPDLPEGSRGAMAMMLNGALHLTARDAPIATLITPFLEDQLDRAIVDQTGLTKKYDFKVEFAPEPGGAFALGMMGRGGPPPPPPGGGASPSSLSDAEPAATLFAALEGQLGLRLESKKVAIEVIVLDRLEKVPTEN